MEINAVTQGYTTTAGDSQPVLRRLQERMCKSVMPATPAPVHRSQSGKDAPKKTTEGAGEHAVRKLTATNSAALRRNDDDLPGCLFILLCS